MTPFAFQGVSDLPVEEVDLMKKGIQIPLILFPVKRIKNRERPGGVPRGEPYSGRGGPDMRAVFQEGNAIRHVDDQKIPVASLNEAKMLLFDGEMGTPTLT